LKSAIVVLHVLLCAWFSFSHSIATEPQKTELQWRPSDFGWQLVFKDSVIGEYRTSDPVVKRPFWCNLKSLFGTALTRPHPASGNKETGGDHADMHPGLWLAYGDLNGVDFWRNKGTIRHLSFVGEPTVGNDGASLCAKNQFEDLDGNVVCLQQVRYRISIGKSVPELKSINLDFSSSWHIALETTIQVADQKGDSKNLVFGNQEEMGLGIRMAPELTEKASGKVSNSIGAKSAKDAWGQPATWWRYGSDTSGILVATKESNPLPSWGHSRDYGVLVVNPTSPPKSDAIFTLKAGNPLTMSYEVWLYDKVQQ
jgi:hypothetical protein